MVAARGPRYGRLTTGISPNSSEITAAFVLVDGSGRRLAWVSNTLTGSESLLGRARTVRSVWLIVPSLFAATTHTLHSSAAINSAALKPTPSGRSNPPAPSAITRSQRSPLDPT